MTCQFFSNFGFLDLVVCLDLLDVCQLLVHLHHRLPKGLALLCLRCVETGVEAEEGTAVLQ